MTYLEGFDILLSKIIFASGQGSRSMGAVTVVLEWQFSPPDFFEEPITVSRDDYTMAIDNGKVKATIASVAYDANPSMDAVLHETLNGRFLGVQLLSHRPYELSKPKMTRVHPDGRIDTRIVPGTDKLTLPGYRIDTQEIDENGKVVSDSRQDRIKKKKSLANLVSTYCTGDILLASLLKSYKASVYDPDNELVHLYEIREALSDSFGGERATKSTLGVSSSDWSRLTHLCCNEPLRQGRHRGRFINRLRDAIKAELEEARGIARTMVEAYLQYLQDSVP